MDIPWRAALLVVAAAFLVFLLAKMLPAKKRGDSAGAALSGARARVREAKSDRDRPGALCEAGDASMGLPFGSTRAAAYFLRAMRVDPAWPGAVERATTALAPRRARVLEKIMWRRLAATPWDEAHGPVIRAMVRAMVTV